MQTGTPMRPSTSLCGIHHCMGEDSSLSTEKMMRGSTTDQIIIFAAVFTSHYNPMITRIIYLLWLGLKMGEIYPYLVCGFTHTSRCSIHAKNDLYDGCSKLGRTKTMALYTKMLWFSMLYTSGFVPLKKKNDTPKHHCTHIRKITKHLFWYM